MTTINPTKWTYIPIPHRDAGLFTTYKTWNYSDMPEVEIFEPFKKFVTVQDIQENLLILHNVIRSPTSCYFSVEGNVFYRDQQDCIIWSYDSEKGVYTDNGDIVAKSIPEFLTRIYIENCIWFKLLRLRNDIGQDSDEEEEKEDNAGMKDKHWAVLTKWEKDYLLFLREKNLNNYQPRI